MKKALDYVTVEVDYERPHFDFPSLSGEAGNPMVFWKMALDALKAHGFHKEVQEIPDYKKFAYQDQFNVLAYYLDFTERQEVLNEDEDYVYLKVRKNESLQKTTKQLPLFKINNKEKLESFYLTGTDLSVTNCYGRNLLYYLDDYQALSYILELNKTEQFLDLFALDNMNTTVLYAHADNLQNFTLILNHMADENAYLTNMMLHGMNLLDMYPLEKYLKHLDVCFSKKNVTEIDISTWDDFGQSLKVIKKINPELNEELLNMIKKIPFIQAEMKKPSHLADPDNPILKMYHHFLLNNQLKEHSEHKPKLKI